MQKYDDNNIASNISSNNNNEGQKKGKTKLILYKNVNENKKNNLYYYCNEDIDQNSTKPIKYGNTANKNSNNYLMDVKKNNNKNNNYNPNNNNKINNNNNINENNNLKSNNDSQKKTSMINYVTKVDKSKNLFVFKGDNRIGFNMIKQNNNKESKYNRNNNNNYYYYNDLDNNEVIKEEKVNIFNIKILKNINANEIKIISDKKYELPISNKCYFNKSTIFVEKRYQLPISNICYLKRFIIFTEEKIKLPISDICYFNKSTIIKEERIMHSIINNYYFCTKENKINKKRKSFIIENCIGLDFIKKKKKYFFWNSKRANKSKSSNKNENGTKEVKIFKYTPKPKKKNKENDAKFKEYKKKLNDRLKNYKTIKHEDVMKKMKNDEKEYKTMKYGNSIRIFKREDRREQSKKNIKKNFVIKQPLNKINNSFNSPKNKIKRYIISKTDNKTNLSNTEGKNKYLNSSASFNDSNTKNNMFKYSFYSLFDINNKKNEKKDNEERIKNKKKILQRFIENGQNKNSKNNIIKEEKEKEKENENQKENENEKNNNCIIPKLFENINKITPKSKTIINTQSSRYLIKKINSSKFNYRNNNNSLYKIAKNQNNLVSMNSNDNQPNWLFKSQIKDIKNNDLPGLFDNKNVENTNECNHMKYDKHFGNETNCPKCQSMDMKINYLKEKKNHAIPNINSHQQVKNNNSFNKTLDNFKRDNIIFPLKYFEKLYLKNYNNYRNNSKNILSKLQRNNSVIQIKKININKYSQDILKNYKSSLLAIKEYFNIK